jgi:hypothetical protein
MKIKSERFEKCIFSNMLNRVCFDCPIDVCQQEQLETAIDEHIYGMVFSMTWLEFKDMAQDPLIRREPVSASCNQRKDEGLETLKYSLCPKEHPANCPLRWRLSNGLGVYLS